MATEDLIIASIMALTPALTAVAVAESVLFLFLAADHQLVSTFSAGLPPKWATDSRIS